MESDSKLCSFGSQRTTGARQNISDKWNKSQPTFFISPAQSLKLFIMHLSFTVFFQQCSPSVLCDFVFSLLWGTCGQYCNPETNERGLRLLEFASYNNLNVANTFGDTNHLDAGHGTAQEETTTIRSTTSWSNDDSSQV